MEFFELKKAKEKIRQKIKIGKNKPPVILFLFLKKNMTINEIVIATITCANFVNLKNLIII